MEHIDLQRAGAQNGELARGLRYELKGGKREYHGNGGCREPRRHAGNDAASIRVVSIDHLEEPVVGVSVCDAQQRDAGCRHDCCPEPSAI